MLFNILLLFLNLFKEEFVWVEYGIVKELWGIMLNKWFISLILLYDWFWVILRIMFKL